MTAPRTASRSASQPEGVKTILEGADQGGDLTPGIREGEDDVELRFVRLGLDAKFVGGVFASRLMCSVRYGETWVSCSGTIYHPSSNS
ncbi:hypothetical protein ACTWPT_48840 [Nonomuraea sp. 3N208]|uniref:hypothetical protein n=1 Tax=Nonomuraea sp. 3N208 TaxID=3457421 RepID=UPI003FD28CF8